MRICVVAWRETGIPAGTMLTVGHLGCFGCPVLLDFGGSVNCTCCNHDGEEVVAIDISGKIEETDEDNCLVTHKATSTAGSDGVAPLHCAKIAAAVAEYMGGGCYCAFRFKFECVQMEQLSVFDLSFRVIISLDFLAVEFILVVIGASGN